jgi:hypothetical protein
VGVLGYRCACNIGWMLGSDQQRCNRKLKTYVIYKFIF